MAETISGLNDQQLRILLGEALAHVTRREFASAERILVVVLTARPEEPNALHVFGQMRRVQNGLGEAESFSAARSRPILPARNFIFIWGRFRRSMATLTKQSPHSAKRFG